MRLEYSVELTPIQKMPKGQAFLAAIKTWQSERRAALADLSDKKIFLSYAWEPDLDKNAWLYRQLKTIKSDLEAAGLSVLFVSLPAGLSWYENMKQHLRGKDVVIPVCTPHFYQRLQEFRQIDCENNERLKEDDTDCPHVIPLRLSGEFNPVMLKKLRSDFEYNLTNSNDYAYVMTAFKSPFGILPNLLNIKNDEAIVGYKAAFRNFEAAILTQLPLLNKDFVGREDVLEKLWRQYTQQEKTSALVVQTLRSQGVYPTEGFGKTEVGLAFAHRHYSRGDYDLVRWIDAHTQELLYRSFADLARALGVYCEGVSPEKLAQFIYAELAVREWRCELFPP